MPHTKSGLVKLFSSSNFNPNKNSSRRFFRLVRNAVTAVVPSMTYSLAYICITQNSKNRQQGPSAKWAPQKCIRHSALSEPSKLLPYQCALRSDEVKEGPKGLLNWTQPDRGITSRSIIPVKLLLVRTTLRKGILHYS